MDDKFVNELIKDSARGKLQKRVVESADKKERKIEREM